MTAPAGWYADPVGRFEHRYWDGSEWTEHVARGGQTDRDPLGDAVERDSGDTLRAHDATVESAQPSGGATGFATGATDPAADTAVSDRATGSQGEPSTTGVTPGITTDATARRDTTELPSQPPTAGPVWSPPSGTTVPTTNGLAVGALIVGILSLLGVFIVIGGFGGIAAIVMGGMARKRIRESDGREGGDGLALAGIVCGATALLLSILAIVLLVVGALFLLPFADMPGGPGGPEIQFRW